MAVTRSEFRECLYCFKELDAGSSNKKNFCNGTCNWKFKQGMTPAKFREECEKNQQIPVRPAHLPEKELRLRRSADNIYHRICKLGDLKDNEGKPLCDVKFSTLLSNKRFCDYSHQVKYNSIIKQARKVARRKKLL